MKARIYTAVLFSVVLVGGALWFRLAPDPMSSLGVIIVHNTPRETAPEKEFLVKDFLETGSSTTSITNKPLSETDLISRQLFSDYIDLKSNGKVTPETVNALAEKYANKIASEEKSVGISKSQISIIPDSEESLRAYGNTISKMRQKYETQIKTLTGNEEFTDIVDPDFKVFMLSLSALYSQAAKELQKIAVPNSLADNQLMLINNYLSSVRATKEIADIAQNPIKAYAALNTQTQNSVEEASLISNIQVALISKGIFSPSEGI